MASVAASNRPCPDLSALGVRRSAAILPFPSPRRPVVAGDFAKACARLVDGAFPGPSRHAQAMAAAAHLGCSPDTIERILSGATRHPDPRLMLAVLAVWQARTGRGFDLGAGLVLQIAVAGAA